MAVEAELKLSLPESERAHAKQVLETLAGGEGHAVRLSNVYFDTPALALKGARSALRVRLSGDRWLQTFKSGGGAQAGLHRRHEWEIPVGGDALETDALIAAIERDLAATNTATDSGAASASNSTAAAKSHAERDGLHTALETLRNAVPALGPLFRTDFTRTIWNIEEAGSEIEAGLDEGDVIVGEGEQRRTLPILEIELELKRGDEAALHRIAARLAEQIPGLKADDVSKAERGYRLRDTVTR
ncbi:triphosphatase [Pararobbsia alpina]|uniref:CYTH domain-containing protein n=1 Tax=Pararobbsia alpina TaxID=621374 RepID=UPI0039A5476B